LDQHFLAGQQAFLDQHHQRRINLGLRQMIEVNLRHDFAFLMS
jgi:hypothetical protein